MPPMPQLLLARKGAEGDPRMKRFPLKKKIPAVLAAVAAAVLMLAACPAQAQAQVAHSVDPVTGATIATYDDIDAAVTACSVDVVGADGPVLVLDQDLMLNNDTNGHSALKADGCISIERDKKLTIDMNGHKIDNDNFDYSLGYTLPTISVKNGAELTLMSSKTADISYRGYTSYDGDDEVLTTTTGGLITNAGSRAKSASKINTSSGIIVGAASTLTLDNVTVAGCNAGRNLIKDKNGAVYATGSTNGGITLSKNSILNMCNKASVEHNKTTLSGAGVYAEGSDITINMDNASISDNHAQFGGGGIASYGDDMVINMTEGSTISRNVARRGGGITFTETNFKIVSSDGDAFINDNKATEETTLTKGGGGIYTTQIYSLDKDSGLLEGITFSGNYSASEGGALKLNQENTVVRNCTITGNTSRYEGGGIFVNNDGNTIDGCTITGNACNLKGGSSNYGGGGVFVSCTVDLKLSGTCLIYGNTRGEGSGNADDLFLNENAGATAKAYVTGSLDRGSKVGVRDGVAGDRMIAKSFSCPTNDCFFIDLDGYYVSYGSDHDGDAWQRKAEMEFAVTVNGEGANRYKCGEPVTVNGTSADASRVFKCWNEEGSTGLYPFSDYVKDATDPELAFTMPQNDVHLVAEYVTRADATVLRVDAPAAGKGLPASGTISWKTGDGTWKQDGVAVSWLERSGDTWVPASGTAKYGTEYAAVASVAQDLDVDRAFAFDIDASKQQALVGGAHAGVASASVDASGRLTVRTNPVATDGPKVVGIDGLAIEVAEGTSEKDFLGLVPATVAAKTDADMAVTLVVGTDGVDFSEILEDGAVVRPEGGTATFMLPVSSSGGATVPSGMTAALTVTVTEAPVEEVEAPEVSPAAGTYATGDASAADKFSDGRLKVGATCATEGAEVRYALSRYEDGAWTEIVKDAAWPASDLLLEPEDGGQAGYRVEVWAVKGGSESARRTLTYVIDDVQPAETVAVTVRWTDTGIDPVEKEIGAFDAEKGGDFTFTAPDRPGYSFEKWTDASGKKLGTDATLTLEKVSAATTVTAVYNPVVSAIDVEIDLPQDDTALASGATMVRAKVAGSDTYTDASGYFVKKDGKVAISWSPSDETASHATQYTATMEVAPLDSGVKYVFLPTAEVKVNGMDVYGGAYVVERDGKTSVCVRCPVTGPAEYESVDELETVKLSYKQAYDAARSQGAGDGLSGWNLPSTVKVRYECGESEDYEITWNDIIAFDENATGAQELTATGSISFTDRGSYVSHQGDTETVTVKVRVAAKETVATPTASVEPGVYKAAQKVELECETEGAAIRYTTDGTDPTEGSPAYDGAAIEVAKTTEIRARAYADGMAPSKVATFAYTIDAGGDGKKDDPDDKKDDGDDSGKKDDSDKKDDGKADSDESGSGKGNSGADNGGNGSGTTTTVITSTTVKSASGKELAGTGDHALIAVAALLVVGLAIALAGLLTTRRKR